MTTNKTKVAKQTCADDKCEDCNSRKLMSLENGSYNIEALVGICRASGATTTDSIAWLTITLLAMKEAIISKMSHAPGIEDHERRRNAIKSFFDDMDRIANEQMAVVFAELSESDKTDFDKISKRAVVRFDQIYEDYRASIGKPEAEHESITQELKIEARKPDRTLN